MGFNSQEARERQLAQESYNNFVGERMRGNAVEQERVRSAASARQMATVIEKGLRQAVDSQPDLFPPFDYTVAADIVIAYILGGR